MSTASRRNEAKVSKSYFLIFYGNIALRPISYAAKMLVIKTPAAKILMAKLPNQKKNLKIWSKYTKRLKSSRKTDLENDSQEKFQVRKISITRKRKKMKIKSKIIIQVPWFEEELSL